MQYYDFNLIIGKNLRALRQSSGLTQEKMAELLYISRPALSSLENGKSHISFMLAVQIAEIMSIDIRSLYNSEL